MSEAAAAAAAGDTVVTFDELTIVDDVTTAADGKVTGRDRVRVLNYRLRWWSHVLEF